MKKLLVILLAVCAVNLYAANVYVGGVVMDGTDRTPAYWLNGTLNFLSLSEPLQDGASYGGMAVENWIVYMCVREGRYLRVYKNKGDKVCEIDIESNWDIRFGRVSDLAVVNGKAYIGIYDDQGKRFCLYKNGQQIATRAGEYIIAQDGAIYYTIHSYKDRYYNDGYSAGGFDYHNTNPSEFHVEGVRIINGNLYMVGYDYANGRKACIQTNNTRRDYIEGYGDFCLDMAIVNGQYYYIMKDRTLGNKLINQNGELVLSSSYEPLQIIGHGGYVYILFQSKQGAVPERYVGIYDPSANSITSYYKLPSCVGAYDFYVVD